MAVHKRNNPAAPVPIALEDIDSERYPVPASEVTLTPEERALLADADWITEDDADIIICERRERAEGHRARPFREYLKSRGYVVED